jgi:transposase InsO family protein
LRCPRPARVSTLPRRRGQRSHAHQDQEPQTNGICERFHKTLLDAFYRVAFRKKLYRSFEDLQADLDEWMRQHNEAPTHQGRWCFGKTPMQTFLDSRAHARKKQTIGKAA